MFIQVVCMLATIGFLIVNENQSKNESIQKSRDVDKHPEHFSYDANDLQLLLNPNQTFAQKNVCRLPMLKLVGHNNVEMYTKCRQKSEWGYLKSNRWHLNRTVVNVLHQIKCQYRAIVRVDDFQLKYSNFVSLVDEQLVQEEVIEVMCKAILFHRRMQFIHLYAQIVPKKKPVEVAESSDSDTAQCKPLNIILLSYDSLSRVSWFKRLPKTTNYILNQMKFNMLYGQSILGDGTPACKCFIVKLLVFDFD